MHHDREQNQFDAVCPKGRTRKDGRREASLRRGRRMFPSCSRSRLGIVPQWGMNGANAAAVPVSPVKTNSPETLVELIPYGCSRLRIAEFPTV